MSDFQDYREKSRQSWGTSRDRSPSLEEINTGAILRIADAVEKTASSYDNMRTDRDNWKRRYEETLACTNRLVRRVSALKGIITKMKKQPAAQKGTP